ncbi:hypothetical protein CISIN_1g043592mg [Citrus sinensis]|uniref:Uncharacterized protein n=1 Tax=Citrus sinensis TaxID=2711 RepID=A0A067H4S8_CITSI|nr:hypothetical protein CISIN_1g043592mg [Citrus sinensis]
MEFVDASLLQFCKRKVCLPKLRVFPTLLDVKVSAHMAGEWIGIGHSEDGERMVRWLTGECSLLEDLFCSDCWDLKHLLVSKAVKLKVIGTGLSVEEIEILEIGVPSFQLLTFLFLGGSKDHA